VAVVAVVVVVVVVGTVLVVARGAPALRPGTISCGFRLVLGVVTATSGPTLASLIGDFFAASERGNLRLHPDRRAGRIWSAVCS